MIRRTLTCLLTLGLVACATQPSLPTPPPAASAPPAKPPSTPVAPASAAAEAPALPPVDLTPVPFEIARANFVRDTAAKYGIDAAQIEAVLAQAQFKDAIVTAMSRPAERVKPWNEYRPMFITQARIDGGRKFLAEHRAELSKVEAATGVPAQVIVAIIGVETSYGSNAGKYRVLDALYTLAFRYPRSGDRQARTRSASRAVLSR